MHGTPVGNLFLVIDTTVLSNFAAVGRVALLAQYCGDHAATTPAVVQEIEQGLVRGHDYLRAVLDALSTADPSGWLRVVILEALEEELLTAGRLTRLGQGEASCLAIAVSRGVVLATDDLAARQVARDYGVRLTGTLGILVQSVREGVASIADANGVLQGMVEQGYRSPVKALDELL